MSTTAVRPVYKSSELSRASAEVFEAAADQPVEVTRRDGESLVLMSEREDRARTSLVELAAHLIAVATSTKGTLTERMSDHYPWILALSEADRDTAAADILDAARASFATNQPHLAISTLHAWHETANAIAAGLGNTQVDWLDDDDAAVVERP
jgi:hypothetical protein